MTIWILGKGDLLLVPKLTHVTTSFGAEVQYTKPSYDWCYSKYGFYLPLDYEALPAEIIFNNELPLAVNRLNHFSQSLNYLHISTNKHLFKTMLSINKKGGVEISSNYIYTKEDCWWTTMPSSIRSHESEQLLGFLLTDPTIPQIKNYFYKYHLGLKLEELSINVIVENLKNNYSYSVKDHKILEDLLSNNKLEKNLSDIVIAD